MWKDGAKQINTNEKEDEKERQSVESGWSKSCSAIMVMLPEKAYLVVESRTKIIYDDTNAYHESFESIGILTSTVKTTAVKSVPQTVVVAVEVR